MKSDLAAPGDPGLKIEVIEDHQRTKPAPFTGGSAAGGAQTVDQRNPNDTFAIEVTLKLLGQEVGYFLNDVAFGGVTFGWGPLGSSAIAFVDDKGRVVLLDRDKHKKIVPGTRDATFPAWSPDGRRIADLQKDGRRKYRLMTAGW
jgi:WD40-like Beta Propeller Repeat